MKNDDSKLSMWVILAAILCCGFPLLLILGGGTALTLGISFLTNNLLLLILGLAFAALFIWVFIKRKNRE